MSNRSSDPVEFVHEQWHLDMPWCDVCKLPAIWNDPLGYLHATAERPGGVPPHEDLTGHSVSVREWLNAPIGQCGPRSV